MKNSFSVFVTENHEGNANSVGHLAIITTRYLWSNEPRRYCDAHMHLLLSTSSVSKVQSSARLVLKRTVFAERERETNKQIKNVHFFSCEFTYIFMLLLQHPDILQMTSAFAATVQR